MDEQDLIVRTENGGDGRTESVRLGGSGIGRERQAREGGHVPGLRRAGARVAPHHIGGRRATTRATASTVRMSDVLDIDLQQPVGEEPPRSGKPLQDAWRWCKSVLWSWGPPLLAVLMIRSCVVEPFQIPSGSMVPTLAIGDFIVVSKFTYGLRIPFTNIEILELGEPERGDINVFIHPPTVSDDPWCRIKRIPKDWTFELLSFMPGPTQPCTTDYVKRLVGLPGETIEVRDDIVYIDGVAQKRVPSDDYDYVDVRGCYGQPMYRYEETLGAITHTTLQTKMEGMRMRDMPPTKVPEGHYFYMGDNRDNSADSRIWHFVPREYIRGKAKVVWLSFDPCKEGGMPGLGYPRTERIGHGLE